MIFGMGNTWVILRRNVICLYSKKPHLDQLFSLSKFPDMRSLLIKPGAHTAILVGRFRFRCMILANVAM